MNQAENNVDGIAVTFFKREDRPALWALSERVRPQNRVDTERWAWQYEKNPYAPVPDIAIAWNGDTAVAQIATMRVRASVLGEEVDACWQGDSMVDPGYRRRGIATALFRQHAGRHPLMMALGTSDAMFALRMKEGWIHVQPSFLVVRPLNAAEVLKGKVKVRWLARVLGYLYDAMYPVPHACDGRVSRVGTFDEAATELWERVAQHVTVGVRRDARFLNWRYGDVPGKDYIRLEFRAEGGRLRGYCVAGWLTKRGVFALVDILALPDDEEAIVALTMEVLRLAKEARATRTYALVTDVKVRRCLAKCGFFGTRHEARLTCAPMPGLTPLLSRSANWYVTLGDSDEELTA